MKSYGRCEMCGSGSFEELRCSVQSHHPYKETHRVKDPSSPTGSLQSGQSEFLFLAWTARIRPHWALPLAPHLFCGGKDRNIDCLTFATLLIGGAKPSPLALFRECREAPPSAWKIRVQSWLNLHLSPHLHFPAAKSRHASVAPFFAMDSPSPASRARLLPQPFWGC